MERGGGERSNIFKDLSNAKHVGEIIALVLHATEDYIAKTNCNIYIIIYNTRLQGKL